MGLEDLRGGSTCKFSSQCLYFLTEIVWTFAPSKVGNGRDVRGWGRGQGRCCLSSRVNVIYLPETTTSPEVSGHEFGFFYTRSVSDVGRVQ